MSTQESIIWTQAVSKGMVSKIFKGYDNYQQETFPYFSFYVDDIIVTSVHNEEHEYVGKHLGKEFSMNDMEKLKYFLGIDVAHSKHRIFISQQKYVTDLLRETEKNWVVNQPTLQSSPIINLGDAKEDHCVNIEMYQKLVENRIIYPVQGRTLRM